MLKNTARLCAALLLWLAPAGTNAQTQTILPEGAVWKYLDNGSNQGTAWRASSFNDSSWISGNAELGYGGDGEVTLLSYGPSSTNKYVTTYFRKSFTVASPANYSSLSLQVLRDDGAIVYLNGTEVFRTNMPAGTVSYTTLASAAVGGADESAYFTTALLPGVLTSGTNVFAVELHQSALDSSDVSFNLKLTGQLAVAPAGTPPVANSASVSTPQNAKVAVTLTGSDLETPFGMLPQYAEQQFINNLTNVTDGLSGATWNGLTSTLFLIRNVSGTNGTIYEYSSTGGFIRSIAQSNFNDTEAIAWMSGTTFAIAEENNEQRISICTIPAGTGQTLNRLGAGNVSFTTPVGNAGNFGIESLCFDSNRNLLYYTTEHALANGTWPIFKLDPVTGVSTILCDVKTSMTGVVSDLSDIAYDRATDTLILVCEEGSNDKFVRINLAGSIIETKSYATLLGQAEAVALSADRKQLYVMGEPKQFARYQLPNETLTFSVIGGSGPAHGTLSGSPPALFYTPAAGFAGTDSFQFKANDGSLDSASATITINVIPEVSITAVDNLCSEPLNVMAPGTAGYKGKATFRVSRTGANSFPLTVSLAGSGTAQAGTDYTLVSQVTIPSGSASSDFSPVILNDEIPEIDETIIATVSASSAYTRNAGAQSATVTIVEAPGVIVNVSTFGKVSGNFQNPANSEYEPVHHMFPRGISSPPAGQTARIVGTGEFEGYPEIAHGFTSSIPGAGGVYAIPGNIASGFSESYGSAVNDIAYALGATGNSHRMAGTYYGTYGNPGLIKPFYFQDLNGPFANWQIVYLPLAGGSEGRANAVDEAGNIVGSVTFSSGLEQYVWWSTYGYPANPFAYTLGTTAFPSENSVGTDIVLRPSGSPTSNYVVGNLRAAAPGSPSRGFFMTGEPVPKELKGPGNAVPAEVNAVNGDGFAAGFYTSGSNRQACVWHYPGSNVDPTVSSLNGLSGFTSSVANDINATGVIVGHSFNGSDPADRAARRAWAVSSEADAVPVDLSALLQPAGFISINDATGINANNMICGYGVVNESGLLRYQAFMIDFTIAD